MKFACEPEHVFPDTTHNERAIECIDESWNETLTKCVGELSQTLLVGGLITVLTIAINHKLFSLLAAVQETLGRQINLVNEKFRAGKMSSESEMSGEDRGFDKLTF